MLCALAGAAPPSANVLRNSGFLRCANPGVPDWWGTGAPEQIENWEGCYGTEQDSPLPGIHSLRLSCSSANQGISVQSYAYVLPSGREYTFSLYLKGSRVRIKADLRLGDQSRSLEATREWERYTLTATPRKGHWAGGRLVVSFGVQGEGTLWVAAPQLEYGGQATEYRPADFDSQPQTTATQGPSIPPHPLPVPTTDCPRTATPPVIDGNLDEGCYSQAAKLTGFRDMQGSGLSPAQTDGYVLRDKGHLYIAFRCYESDVSKLTAKVTTRDGAVFADDSLEVFLQPDPKSTDYLHFAVNALGAQFDEKQYDTGWNADWQVATARGTGEWTVELAFPFGSLGLTSATKGTWGLNLCRNRPRDGEVQYSQWSCTYIGYHVPSRFGEVRGFSPKELRPYFAKPAKPTSPQPTPGATPVPLVATFEYSYYTSEPTARLWVRSNLGQRARVALELLNRLTRERRELPPENVPGGPPGWIAPNRSFYVSYDLSELSVGEYDATVIAKDQHGTEIARVATPLTKLQPSSVEVKMNRVNRYLLVNGKPFLAYSQGIHGMRGGWWLQDIASHGFNTVIAGCGAYRSDEELNRDEPRVRGFLDECQSAGLKVILWLSPGSGPYPPMREAVARTITRLKDHPAILLWYLVDEPEGWWGGQDGGKKEEDLIDLYRAAKAADPYRPAHINWYAWSKGKGGYGSLDATDIGSLDRYPVGRGNAVKATSDIAGQMNEDCRPRHQPTAFWAQMYGYDDAVREPTREEEKGMTYVCLIHGMRLVYYFIYKPMSPDLWESMKGLGDELGALRPVLCDPDAKELAIGTSSGRVPFCLWQRRGRYYLIACSYGDEGAQISLDLRKLTGHSPRHARTWFEELPVKLAGGKLQVVLNPNQRVVVELE